MIYRHPGKSGAGWYRGDLRDLYMFLTKATGKQYYLQNVLLSFLFLGSFEYGPENKAWNEVGGISCECRLLQLYFTSKVQCAPWGVTEDKNTIICFNPNLSNVSI